MKKTLGSTMALLAGCLLCSQAAFGEGTSGSDEIKSNLERLLSTRSCQQCNLQGVNLKRADLAGVDLSGADLSGALFQLANLAGADLSRAILNGANFGGTDLAGTDLREADLTGVSLGGAYTVGALLEGSAETVDGQKVDTTASAITAMPERQSEAVEQKTELTEKLPEAGSTVSEDDRTELPQLEDKELAVLHAEDKQKIMVAAAESPPAPKISTPVGKVKQPAARPAPPSPGSNSISEDGRERSQPPEPSPPLAVADAGPVAAAADKELAAGKETSYMDDVAEKVAVAGMGSKKTQAMQQLLDSGRCYGCDLSGLSFSGASLKNVDLERANLTGCDFSNAKLRNGNFKGATLVNANLQGADLRGTDFYKADLSGALMEGANLEDAIFEETELTGVTGLSQQSGMLEN